MVLSPTGLVRVEKFYVVHDCGRMINPMIVDGLVQGGIAQGIGEALMEAVQYYAEEKGLQFIMAFVGDSDEIVVAEG